MKNILLIGAGRFGRHLAIQMMQLGHQIMAVDISEERINSVLPYVTTAVTARTRISSAPSASVTTMSASSPSAAASRTRWKPPRF